MKLIKLDAIDSTNDFLKTYSQNHVLENYTVVTAQNQFKGKGQMGASWETEVGKNLIISILIKDLFQDVNQIFSLNVAVAIAVVNALKKNEIPNLTIKWANDILSENKKIAGILIENIIKSDGKIESIVGIGLNVNQTNFSHLPQASSLINVTGKNYNIDSILIDIVKEIQSNCQLIVAKQIDLLWKTYHELLFKINTPMVFENIQQGRFMGIIQRVNQIGQLEVLLEDDSVKVYGIKEISMLY